jgi:hypothetical protein
MTTIRIVANLVRGDPGPPRPGIHSIPGTFSASMAISDSLEAPHEVDVFFENTGRTHAGIMPLQTAKRCRVASPAIV